jgi:hypothetical protein
MRESAITAPDRKMPAADSQVMRAGDVAIPAGGGLDQLPEIITANLRESTFFTDVLDTRNEHAGCSAVIAGNLGLVGNSFNDLVSNFPAMIAVSAVPCEDEPVAHGR